MIRILGIAIASIALCGPAMAEPSCSLEALRGGRDLAAPQNRPVPHPDPAFDLRALPAGQVFAALERGERKAIQQVLARLGLYAGRIDGSLGPMTWDAICGYARQAGRLEWITTPKGSIDLFRHMTN